MQQILKILVTLLGIFAVGLASPVADDDESGLHQRVPRATSTRTTTTTKANAVNAVVSALCTQRSRLFPASVLTSASSFCTTWLKVSRATVTATATATTVTLATIVTASDVSTSIVVSNPPLAAFTVVQTITPLPVTITNTASTPLITSTITALATLTVTQSTTVTSTSTRMLEKREEENIHVKRQGGIFAGLASALVSTACKCLVTSPAPTTITSTATATARPTSTITVAVVVTITSVNAASTTTVTDTVTGPASMVTVTKTPDTSTVTLTELRTGTVTTTLTSTSVVVFDPQPTNKYTQVYASGSCCINGYNYFFDWTKDECSVTPADLLRDCQVRCDARSDCAYASLVNYAGCDYACVLSGPGSSPNIQSPCYGPCQIYQKG